jgi:hypothetical protein
MPLVRNKSSRYHRYPLWESQGVILWHPGETLEVPPEVAEHVCRVHPDKLELVVEPPVPSRTGRTTGPAAEPESGDFNPGLSRVVNRRQRGGRRS